MGFKDFITGSGDVEVLAKRHYMKKQAAAQREEQRRKEKAYNAETQRLAQEARMKAMRTRTIAAASSYGGSYGFTPSRTGALGVARSMGYSIPVTPKAKINKKKRRKIRRTVRRKRR